MIVMIKYEIKTRKSKKKSNKIISVNNKKKKGTENK